MNEQKNEPRISTFSRRWLKAENYLELHFTLAPFVVFLGIGLVYLGSVMAFWNGGENEFKDIKIGHSLTVMAFGILLVCVAFIFSLIDGWQRLRGKKVEIEVNLDAYVKKSEVKRNIYK